ncbi:MAG: protein translocase subunit SecD [Actinomycetota bacterium]
MKPTTKLALSVIVVGILVAGAVVGFIRGVKPNLGLDLQGGISVVLEAPAGTPANVLDLAVENIRARVDATGVSEAAISVVGNRDIQVEVPGGATGKITKKNGKFCGETADGRSLGCNFDTQSEAQARIQAVGQQDLLNTIGTTARLEEREVTGQPAATDLLTSCPPSMLKTEPKCSDPKVVKCPLNDVDKAGCTNNELSSQDVIYLGRRPNPSTNTDEDCTTLAGCPRIKMGPVQITGEAIKKAVAQPPDQNHAGWWVGFTLTGSGSAKFGEITTRLAQTHAQLAIVLDRQVVSAPSVQNPITSGSGEITGSFSESDARDLAKFLNYGALPVELQRQNVETISPTLGKQSLHQGLIAGIAGLILLMLYLAFYYRLLGIVTWFGMSIWAVFALSLISVWPNYALSLAGIAGIIVSMGITADSYIVFYERLKDEVRHGKTLRAAVQPAFKRAWRTIYTADIVTVLAAIVLYVVSVGSVRGFAFTLGIATFLDMGVVYFFKRPTVFLIARSPRLSNLPGIGLQSGVAADPVPVPVAGGSE